MWSLTRPQSWNVTTMTTLGRMLEGPTKQGPNRSQFFKGSQLKTSLSILSVSGVPVLPPSLLVELCRPCAQLWRTGRALHIYLICSFIFSLSGEQGSQLDKAYTIGYSGYCLFSLLQMLYALLSHFPDLILHQNCSQQRLIFKQQDCHFCHKSKINYLPGK